MSTNHTIQNLELSNIIDLQKHILTNKHDEKYQILDLRSREDVTKTGLLKGSVSIHYNIPFERFISQIISPYSHIAVIYNKDYIKLDDVLTRLKTMTYKNIIGLADSNLILKNETMSNSFYSLIENDKDKDIDSISNVIDVREPWEWEKTGCFDVKSYIPSGELIKMRMLWSNYYWRMIDSSKEYDCVCQSGVRSFVVASYLNTKGIKIRNFSGGMERAIKIGIKLIK